MNIPILIFMSWLLAVGPVFAGGKCRRTGENYTLDNMDLPVCEQNASGLDPFHSNSTTGGFGSGSTSSGGFGTQSTGGFGSSNVGSGGAVGQAARSGSGEQGGALGGRSTGSAEQLGTSVPGARGPASVTSEPARQVGLPGTPSTTGSTNSSGSSDTNDTFKSNGDAHWIK